MSILNLQNGNFQITDSIVVSKDINYDDIIKLAPTKTWDIKNGFKWVYFNDIEIDKLFFNIGVCVFLQRQTILYRFWLYRQQEKNITWDNWNEKDELKRKRNL